MNEKLDVIEYFLEQLEEIEIYMIRLDRRYESLKNLLMEFINEEETVL